MEANNIYLVYYEQTTKEKFTNGQTVQCDTINELLYQLKEVETKKKKNVIINTIVNGKQQ